MANAFHIVMKIVSTLLGLAMVLFGGIWILQGLGIAFQVGFMAGDPMWAVYGAILALFGIGQVVWSVTRRAPGGSVPVQERVATDPLTTSPDAPSPDPIP